jgi:hypothetical protein
VVPAPSPIAELAMLGSISPQKPLVSLSPRNVGNKKFYKIILLRYITDIDKTDDNSIRLNENIVM